MTEKEIIQAWKKNKEPFGLVCKEMQDWAKKMSPQDFYYYTCGGEWELISNSNYNFTNQSGIMQLRPDYPEPLGVVEYEVKPDGDGDLWCYYESGVRICSIGIAWRKPNFIGYKYEDGGVSGVTVRYKDKMKGVLCGLIDLKDIDNYTIERPVAVVFKEVE